MKRLEMTKLEILQRSLYAIARYDHDTQNYIKYNKLLWANIQGLDQEALEDAIITLTECNQ